MTRPCVVLHAAAHLGGGVGRALLAVARSHRDKGLPIRHIFACHEGPENPQFVDRLLAEGFEVHAPVTPAALDELAAEADLVQLDWWHHPRQCAWLVKTRVKTRLIVWAHTSGLHVPAIPDAFVRRPHAFLFTTAASMAGGNWPGVGSVECIPSTGGFDDFPPAQRRASRQSLRYGFIGSLSPAKLHPDFVNYIEAIEHPGFVLDCYGDVSSAPAFRRAAAQQGSRLRFRGYSRQPGAVLRDLDVFIYLLNPEHYGTTENALLEAMACGVVPIVMDNPVERAIVRHGETGWIIRSRRALRDVIERMNDRPDERRKMSAAASRYVRANFALGKTSDALARCYARVLGQAKRPHHMADVFGATPADWLLTGLGRYRSLLEHGSARTGLAERRQHSFLYASTKSSPFHFQRCFPDDVRIREWTRDLEADMAVAAAA